jgi:hypothetical protein
MAGKEENGKNDKERTRKRGRDRSDFVVEKIAWQETGAVSNLRLGKFVFYNKKAEEMSVLRTEIENSRKKIKRKEKEKWKKKRNRNLRN